MLSQLITAPEVIQVLPELPTLSELMKNLYDSHYDKFFHALGTNLPYDQIPPCADRVPTHLSRA